MRRRTPRVHRREPRRQRFLLRHREQQPRRRQHDPREVAADREQRAQVDRQAAGEARQPLADVDQGGALGLRRRDHAHKDQHDEEVERRREQERADERAGDLAFWLVGFACCEADALKAQIGVRDQQRGAAEVDDRKRRARDQGCARDLLKAQRDHQQQRRQLERGHHPERKDAGLHAAIVGPHERGRDEDEDCVLRRWRRERLVQLAGVCGQQARVGRKRRDAAQIHRPASAEACEGAEGVRGVQDRAACAAVVTRELCEGQHDGEEHAPDHQEQPRAQRARVDGDLGGPRENARADHAVDGEERRPEQADLPVELRTLLVVAGGHVCNS